MRTIELTATTEMVKKHYPQTWRSMPIAGRDRRRATFSVDPARCTTALGKWLAENITSTRPGDPGSIVEIAVLGVAYGMPRELAMMIEENNWGWADIRQGDDFFNAVIDWVRRRKIEVKNSQLSHLGPHSIFFEWPDFGSESTGYADTVEAFFDACAQQIYATGGVVLAAGPEAACPPKSLIQTMADGHGEYVLGLYQEMCGMPLSLDLVQP